MAAMGDCPITLPETISNVNANGFSRNIPWIFLDSFLNGKPIDKIEANLIAFANAFCITILIRFF
jgi:hypothetical protein